MASDDRATRSPASGITWPVALVLILVAVLVWQVALRDGSPLHDSRAEPRAVTARGDLAEDEQAAIELFKQASKSAVHITTLTVQRDPFSLRVQEIPKGTGSGFVWSEEGYVVTNFHVVMDSSSAVVTLYDNSTWPAELVGWEPNKDLAVLKIRAPRDRLFPIAVGTSQDLQVGQKVFAIGNPFGLDQTLTTGVISGLGREIESVTRRPIRGVIQTDAAINRGNSGGPLLDSAGRLIGVNAAIYSPSGVSAGIGFAVPVDTVNNIVPQLIKFGKVSRPGLGISLEDDHIVASLKLRGVLVGEVHPGSGAEKAGIRPTRPLRRNPQTGEVILGDLIVEMEGQPINNSNDLFRILDERKIGDVVALTVRRGTALVELQIALQDISG